MEKNFVDHFGYKFPAKSTYESFWKYKISINVSITKIFKKFPQFSLFIYYTYFIVFENNLKKAIIDQNSREDREKGYAKLESKIFLIEPFSNVSIVKQENDILNRYADL